MFYVRSLRSTCTFNNVFIAGPRNEATHGRDMSARRNPKVRQWRTPRKSHDYDMLLVHNGP